jgi:alanyl-tRNA synthetase
MKASEVRRVFLEYFIERGHKQVASSPLILPNDPTLLFANAGMNQFKDLFTGKESREYVRAVSSQKCMRVSGKHNDLEMVGRTPRHHTFFEMLGNFSFGDYFKREAAEFAWELITKVYGVDPDRLWITVFGGSDAAEADEEAYSLWVDKIGVDPARMLRLGEKENFWRMGDTGPCGPCTEIHYDLGEGMASVQGESNPETDENRYMEIWNLVFMQFNQKADGRLIPLPAPSVDTGMGLERITTVMQGVTSNYDTDLFMPLLAAVSERSRVRQGDDPEHDVAMRVIADHVRAMCFLIADGVIPSNDSRGYVLRRILRRAIRYGRKLGIQGSFLGDISPVVLDSLGEIYPEIVSAGDAILEIGKLEERRFSETLTTSLQMLDEALDKTGTEGSGSLDGKKLFKLYDTFGLPLDLARDIAEEKGVALDEAGFEAEMKRQRSQAQAARKVSTGGEALELYQELAVKNGNQFAGYSDSRLEDVEVRTILRDGCETDHLEEGQLGEIVLGRTPFYAEAGGQVGDTGVISGPSGQLEVLDTVSPLQGLNLSRVKVLHGSISCADKVTAEVDSARRQAIRRNHTATHLLHAALREVVGPHVKQAGSRVGPEQLRFDFSHFSGLDAGALESIEELVNDVILDGLEVVTEEMGTEEAIKLGAMALFGEKYGDKVRVVRIGDFSLELCGGIHSANSSEIGLVKVTSEKGIASGIRRLEAMSGKGALARFRDVEAVVRGLEVALAVPAAELQGEVERRLGHTRQLQQELNRLRVGSMRQTLTEKAASAPETSGIRYLATRVDGMKPSEMRELADELLRSLHSGVLVLARGEEKKASLLVGVTDDLTDRLHAGNLVRALAAMIGGGGGGRKDMAEAGGKDVGKLDETLEAVPGRITAMLEAAK